MGEKQGRFEDPPARQEHRHYGAFPVSCIRMAAAMVWARARPDRHSFLTLDERLAEAARKEGFDVISFE